MTESTIPVINSKKSKQNHTLVLYGLSALMISCFIYGGYRTGSNDTSGILKQTSNLSKQIATMKAMAQKQDNVNKGIVVAANPDKDPTDTLELLAGKISFTMPRNWIRLPSAECSRNNIDSTVLCYDTAELAPKNQAKDSKDPYWTANISVFEYKKGDGTARQWFEYYYSANAVVNDTASSQKNVNEDTINNDSVLIYLAGKNTGNDENAFYVIVHGDYAVVVRAQLKYAAIYGTSDGAQPYDYDSTYGPILDHFAKSIMFRDAR